MGWLCSWRHDEAVSIELSEQAPKPGALGQSQLGAFPAAVAMPIYAVCPTGTTWRIRYDPINPVEVRED